MAYPKGTQVRQVVPAPIEGTVDRFSVDQESGEVQYCVKWTDTAGIEQERFFKGSEIEVV